MSGLRSFFESLKPGSEKLKRRAVRAGGFTVTTADAPVVVDDRDSVIFGPRGFDRADLHARCIRTLVALNGHVEMVVVGNRGPIVVVVALLDVDGSTRHLEHADVLDLGWLFSSTQACAFPAPDATGEIQGIDELDAVLRLDVSDFWPDAVSLFDFALDASEDFRHRLFVEFHVLLDEALHGERFFEIEVFERR